MIRRVLVVLVVALVGLLGGAVPAEAAYVFGPWTVTSPPPLADAGPHPFQHIIDTACLSADECVLIGSYYSATQVLDFVTTVTDSATVTTHVPPPPDAALGSKYPVALQAIDCVAGIGCVATGAYQIWNGRHRVLIETRGVTGGWTASTIADVPDGGIDALSDSVYLNHVACNVERCVASGQASQPFPAIPLVYERDNTIPGAPWVKAIGVGPVAAGLTDIYHLVCPPHGGCVATGVGMVNGSKQDEILVEEADGWHAALTPVQTNPGLTSAESSVGSLSCWAPGNCAALGVNIVDVHTGQQGLIEFSLIDGHLQAAQQIALPAGAGWQALRVSGLSCGPPGNCIGVGRFGADALPTAPGPLLVERDPSGVWTATRAPLPPSSDVPQGDLLAVKCVTPEFCVAVGWWVTRPAGRNSLVEVRTAGGWQARGLDLPIVRPATMYKSGLSLLSCAGNRCAAGGEADFQPFSPDVILLARSTALTG